MTVNNVSSTSVSQTNGARKDEATAVDVPGAKQAAKTSSEQLGTEIQLTPELQRLQKLEATLGAQSDIDQNRIEALQKQIDSGSYSVDAVSIATKLFAIEDKLFN